MSKIDLDKMWEGMREGLERDEAAGRLAGLTVKALAEAISHPKAPAMIAEIMAAETSSVAVGEPAPDFSLPWLPGSGERDAPALRLSDHFGKRPVALVFGSYT